jgi:hypothetical protein
MKDARFLFLLLNSFKKASKLDARQPHQEESLHMTL